jgi:hypothetical protein
MTTPESFAELCGDLPDHQAEVMSASQTTWPSLAEQDRTHGAGMPPVDHGFASEQVKYGPGGC